MITGLVTALGGLFVWLQQREATRQKEIERKAAQDERDAANRAAAEQKAKADREEAKAAQERLNAEEARRQKELADADAKAANKESAVAKEQAEKERLAAEAARRAKQELEEGIDIPEPAKPGHRRCSMILIGIGGVGKSTLLERCFHWQDAAKHGKTKVVEMFPTDLDFSAKATEMGIAKDGTRVTCWVTDYVGQNLGTLIRFFVEQQKLVKSPMAYGYINALCVMVDLKHPRDYDYDVKFDGNEELVEVAKGKLKKGQTRVSPEVAKERRERGEDLNPGKPDMDRVEQHLRKWNDQALNAIFGLLTAESLRRVFIFVNKVDVMHDSSPTAKQEYAKLFEKLERRLKERFNNRDVHVIVGSADTGTGHPDVLKYVLEAADPAVDAANAKLDNFGARGS